MSDLLQKMKGSWNQVKTENMDAIYVASQVPYIKRTVAGMMGVKLQVDLPKTDEIFLSFQTKLKNMDMNLSLTKESAHTGLSDEVSKSSLSKVLTCLLTMLFNDIFLDSILQYILHDTYITKIYY